VIELDSANSTKLQAKVKYYFNTVTMPSTYLHKVPLPYKLFSTLLFQLLQE